MRCVQRSPSPQQQASPSRRRAGQGLRRLRLGRRGSSAMEFALVSIPFFTVMITVFELCWQLSADLALNLGAIAGSRYAVTGAAPSSGTRDDAIRQAVLSAAGGVLRDAQLTITTRSYTSPATYAANFATGSGSTTGPGASGQFVVYTLTYVQNFATGFPRPVLGTSLTHTATVLVQNEPY